MSAKHEVPEIDDTLAAHGLDPITALGIMFKCEIPKGEAFVDWILGDRRFEVAGEKKRTDLQTVIGALTEAGYTMNQITYMIASVSHGRFAPRESTLEDALAGVAFRRT